VGTKTHAQKISSRPISFPQDAITCTRDRQAYFSDYPFARSVKKTSFLFQGINTWQWSTTFPLKIAPFHGYMDPHLQNYMVPEAHRWPESTSRTALKSVQPLLQGSRSWSTDRQTDRHA